MIFSPAGQYLLYEFSEFWCAMKRGRAAGDIRERIIHRVREEWIPWWTGLPPERQARISKELTGVNEIERVWLLHSLRTTIEADCERDGCASNGPGSGNWVFMQLSHVEPFQGTPIFAAMRLDRIDGFKALCLHPNQSLPILSVLLRRNGGPSHYEYNIRLNDAVGVTSALTALGHLLKRGSLVFFNHRPRGVSHHPIALRYPLAASLILGPLCVVSIYAAAAIGDLNEELLTRLLAGASLSALLFFSFWLIGIISDWWSERRLARVLAESQVVWALGYILPSPTSRNSLEIRGESFGAALALSVLHSLGARENSINCWILHCLRRAACHMNELGITGELSPTGEVQAVDGFGDDTTGKKALCLGKPPLILLAPNQDQATATASEIAKGLKVEKCSDLEALIWSAAKNGSGFLLWLAAVTASLLLLFAFLSRELVFPAPAPDLYVRHTPIIEDRSQHTQHLILHFRTDCPQCFILRVHSNFWQTPDGQHMAQAKGSDIAVFEIELVPKPGATGNGMESYVEIQRLRRLPFLRLAPEPVEAITFARLNDMYKRSRGVGKYAYPNH